MRLALLLDLFALAAGLTSCVSCSGSTQRDPAGPAGSITGLGARVVAARAAEMQTPFGIGVTIRLVATTPGAEVISFGVPVAPGALRDVSTVAVAIDGAPVAARTKELLADRDATGKKTAVRAFLVQLPGSAMRAEAIDVKVTWRGGDGASPDKPLAAFRDAAVSFDSPTTVETANRTIESSGGRYSLVETGRAKKTLFVGREPRVLAMFPDGYLGKTGILGDVRTASEASGPKGGGQRYLSDAFAEFTLSSMYVEGYPLNPHAESVVDPVVDFSGWLYDRCATYLLAHAHFGDPRFLRQAHRSCSYFSASIDTSGPRTGIFRGKPEPDSKYSHARGLYAWYALTGDESARAALVAIAEMWLSDPNFVTPYRRGRTRGPEKLWTERLLAASLEGLYYGHLVTGEKKYLAAFTELLDTAYRHLTGDAAELAKINPGVAFPPQNCFIHSAEQQSEDSADKPWCSSWMSALLVDVLVRYQADTGDKRVDEIFVRLARFLRDTGTAYFGKDVQNDTFLAPSTCDDPSQGDNRRRLVPLYGAGLRADKKRFSAGEWSDSEHCADATALTAAGIRALVRQGTYDKNPIGPFAGEGASFLALHQELSACATRTFVEQTRARRDPGVWTSEALAAGASDPAKFITDNKIGFPVHVISPQRKLSWWFNDSILQYGLLTDAGIEIPAPRSGAIQPPGCRGAR